MKNILIPTDFSSNAKHAISYALNLFKGERTNFYFIHAYADEVYGPFYKVTNGSIESQKEIIRKNSEDVLNKLVNDIKEKTHHLKHNFEAICSFESLVDGVNDFVNTKNIDLIIMGTKGKTATISNSFGSNTIQIFKYVKCPVLAVPDEYPCSEPKRILFPSDYLLPYKRRELKLIDALAAQFKAEIHSLYISDFDDLSHRQLDNKKFLEESLPNAMLSFVRTSVKNKAEAITTYIKENDINFLVMANSRHSFLEDILYRSTIDEIGLTPTVPFLVLQNLPR